MLDTAQSTKISPAEQQAESEIKLTENAMAVLKRRYLRKGPDGQIAETVAQMFRRVAGHVAAVEEAWRGDVAEAEAAFYDLITSFRFMPNSPTFTGAGTPLRQLAACFVLPVADDMGRGEDGIFQTLRNAALIQQTGGGTGFSFSRLRPRGAAVRSSGGQATGPVGFMRVYDTASEIVSQGGCLIPETLVFTENGLLRLDELVNVDQPGWQSHDVRVATDEGTRCSPRGYNHGVVPVLGVRTDEGLTITGTHNHRVKVMTDRGLEWRRLDHLQPGDYISLKLGQHRGQYQTLCVPNLEHWNQIEPSLPLELDEELAFFLGYLSGDGFVASGDIDHRVGVSVAHTSYLMKEMPALMERLFGLKVYAQSKPGDGSTTFVLDNRAVKDFLVLNDLAKSSSLAAQVPRLVRMSPPEIVGAYLRGLFEADGTLSHGYPELVTASEQLAEEVAVLLIGLGCPVTIRFQELDQNHWGDNPIFRVRIHSYVGLKAWREYIGCDSGSRFGASFEWEPDLTREYSYPLPQPSYWVEPVLEEITLPQMDQRGRGLERKFRSTEPGLRRRLLRYLRGDRRLTRSGYRLLAQTYPDFACYASPVDDRWFVMVEAVEPVGKKLTLDLEVDDNHTYLANGFVTHNSRRGANMAVLRVDHPDIQEFIRCKDSENTIANFNISVGVTDAFMRAVEEDGTIDLVNPQDGEVWKTVRAREIFDEIVAGAHRNGEPGVLFLDTANRENPCPHLGEYEASNPCGEQYLLPYENCCLGSVNLAQHVGLGDNGHLSLDWEKLRKTVGLAARFLDDVVDANGYVPAVPQLEEAAHRTRRIGLGIMGLGDLMYHLGVRYGSDEAQELAAQVMEFVRYHAMRAGVALARERGPFPAIRGSVYDPDDLRWTPPRPLTPYERLEKWGRPPLDWNVVVEGIRRHGIRNAAQTTVAPTGTVATISGCEAYGCEPVFALVYVRHVNDNGKDMELRYTSPVFLHALEEAGLDRETQERVLQQVVLTGSCQGVEELPPHIRGPFVVAADITAEEHVRMQAALQAFVDASISKTINFPATATPEDVARAFKLAWELGCKGLTVYVTGSRERVVLETEATRRARQMPQQQAQELAVPTTVRRPRPHVLKGVTYRKGTPLGTAYITVNDNGGDEPFEVFLTVGKAGSDTAAVAEAIGRLISLVLRIPSPLSATRRLKQVVRQLKGIGGGQPLGFGRDRVRSLPDGVAQVLAEHLGMIEPENDEAGQVEQLSLFPAGDLCPECGHAALVNEEGCYRCYSCGHSEC
jgi:ribonucleoside-diphosphate reductase alpha chain